MCTLIVAWDAFAETPICVAANRDESHDRPAEPPQRRAGDPPFVAPRDERAGGTWLGYNANGVLVGITNRWESGDGDRSRGLLVEDALGERSAREAVEYVQAELQRREYAPFHLVVADAADCFLVEHGAESDESHRLTPGVHVVVNVGFDGEWFEPDGQPVDAERQATNAERVRDALQIETGQTATEWTDRAGDILGDHDYGVCIHGDGFGTQSSSLIRLGADRSFEYADGPPCRTPYRQVSDFV